MKQTFTIPIIFPSLNEIIESSKTHWSKYSKPKKGYTEIVASFTRQQLKPVRKYPVEITCHWICKDRRQDPDNVSAGVKFLLDGLVKAGIIKNDGFNEIKSIHHTFEVDKQNVGVVVTLNE